VELFTVNDSVLDQKIAQWQALSEQACGERRLGDIWVPQTANRSMNSAGIPHTERRILAIWTPEYGRSENLAVSEETQYASYSTIQCDVVYEVIVTLTGVRYVSGFWQRFFRWRRYKPPNVYYTASAISVPADAVPANESLV
jgi:hypothetical protein